VLCKLHFHQYVHYLSSQRLKLLWLIRFIKNNLSSLDCLKILHVALIISKLEYATITWNNLTLADSNNLEHEDKEEIYKLCYSRFDQFGSSRKYDLILECLKFRTFYSERQHLGGLFHFNAFKTVTL
jgi:hypothetical protein